MIQLDSVSKEFEHRGTRLVAIDALSICVDPHEFVALIGPSGCGKSTVLNLIAGLGSPDKGAVYFEGQPVLGPNKKVGYLTQDDALLPWRTVMSNVALPLELQGVPARARQERVAEMIQSVGLSGFERHYPEQLSGGMRKRVALARTLVYGARTLLLDEPFGTLDAQTKVLMHQLLNDLVERMDLTVVMVTHDLNEAVALADRVVVLSRRPATILKVLPVPVARPRDVVRYGAAEAALYASLWDALRGQQV